MDKIDHPSILGKDKGPWDGVKHWLMLAPHPDDFEVVAVTMMHFLKRGIRITLEVLSGGASGVEDAFARGWDAKTAARETEQRESCARFGLPENDLHFHRLDEDEAGHMADSEENRARVHAILDSVSADGVILPHGNDRNADHRRTFRWFSEWLEKRSHQPFALLVRDPKTIGLRVDLIHPYDDEAADWKAAQLRCHRSQHERNLRTRGIGFDERILNADRAAGKNFGYAAVESFECFNGP